jgi:4,5-DOPA dioxygenase extradiol
VLDCQVQQPALAMTAPAAFLGHGSPMNALERNRYTEAWSALGRRFDKPKAILAISAHWYIRGTAVTAMAQPPVIHDFGGFPPALHSFEYPASGDPALAARVKSLLAPLPVRLDDEWGLDHGTWSVLCHVFPNAEVPVVQLSIDETKPAAFHFELGRRLAPLRDEGVLICGSGNLVHNLHTYAWGRHMQEPFDWAVRFESSARVLMQSRTFEPLINYETLGRDALLSIPTPDHYLPLLYVLGATRENDAISFPVEGVDGGSISMLAISAQLQNE